jgi:hypothetical protein
MGHLTISDPALSRKLTTIQRVKQDLGLLDDDMTNDVQIERSIDLASAMAERYCNRVFASQTYVESIEGNDSAYLYLSNYPIIDLVNIVRQNSPVTDYTIIPDTGALYREYGWSATTPIGWGGLSLRSIGQALPLYVVTYEAGYVLPDDPINRTLPADLEFAVATLARYLYDISSTNLGISTISVDGLSVSYRPDYGKDTVGTYPIPPYMRGLFEPFVRYL